MSPKNSNFFRKILFVIKKKNFLELINIFNIFDKKLLFILSLLILANCSSEKKYDKTKAVPAVDYVSDIKIDESLKNISIQLPKAQINQNWLGSSSKTNQQIENISKDFSYQESGGYFNKRNEINLRRTWYKNIFYYEDFAKSFVYSPIILNQKIFNIDSSGDVSAFDLKSKKLLWHKRIFEKLWLKNYKVAHLGACDDKLFAVAGVNQVKAINQNDGELLWQKDLSVIFNSTPICDGEAVYISSSDNKTFALNAKSGEIKWIHYGISKALAIFGSAQPLVYNDFLIASYSSGEIYAINKKTGESLWTQDLNSNKAYNSDFFLNDIDATPLVKNDVVYAIGNGGLMKAISLKTGEDIWKKSIASVVDFWLAGDFLYVINSDNKLLAVSKKTGGIKWIVQLPDFKNPKKIATKFNYIGIIMAGDKLIASREDGELFIISPFDGKIENTFSLNKKVLHVPIIIENKMYFYGMNRYKTKLIELE